LDLIRESVAWGWESFEDYAAAVRRLPLGLNVAPQAGHSAIRRWVMGDDFRREATPDEIARMREVLRAALRAGANGFTSSHGRHIDTDGVPTAGAFASREEVLAIASVLGEENVGVFQMATRTLREGVSPDERAFLTGIALATRRPVTLNGLDHTKDVSPSWLGWLEESAKKGARIRSNAMVMPGELRFTFDSANLLSQ